MRSCGRAQNLLFTCQPPCLHHFKLLLTALFFLLLAGGAYTQDSTLQPLPSGYLSSVAARVDALEEKLEGKSGKAIRYFQQREEKIYRKLLRQDSTRAAQFLASSKVQYQLLEEQLKAPGKLTQYLPSLDTLTSSLKFLGEHKELLGKARDMEGQLAGTLSKVKELEGALARAEALKAFLKQRRDQLREQLQGLPFSRDLKKLNQQAYYYSAQVQEYKALLKDKKQLERKALELLSKTKPFQDFMRKHSQLASLFRLPGSGSGDPTAALQGLQTRALVNSLIQGRIAAGGPGAQAQVRDNMQAAQAQLASLKSQLAQHASGSYGNSTSDLEVPDFRPNSQKTKSFFQRLEVGTNMQSQRARYFFPVTSDLGLSLGYKLNDRSVVGLGASYKLGLGTGWQNIALSHQGVGLRSFIDYKLKGSLYLSGGYEQNYRNEIRSVAQLQDQAAWQVSGLVGLSKKYKVSKKLKGEMKLLWDFMSYQQVPRTQTILFRIGYSLK